MKTEKNDSYFWTSYSDLMTSLFFIMLVLFVLVIALLYGQMRDAQIQKKITEEKLAKIEEVVNSTKNLDKRYFTYNSDYKKFVLNIAVAYPTGASDIHAMVGSPDEILENKRKLDEAGREIQRFVRKNAPTQYLLVIEGQASKDAFAYNYELSYQRALGLVRYWMRPGSGLSFDENCEILIAGSGDGVLETHSWRESPLREKENQRFLIYLLPKNIIQE